MSGNLERLNMLMGEVMDLRHTASMLEWDERVYMPQGAASTRSLVVASVRKVAHQKFTSNQIGELLSGVQAELDGQNQDSETARLVE